VFRRIIMLDKALIFIVFTLLFFTQKSFSAEVVYPGKERNDYIIKLLKLSYEDLHNKYHVKAHGLDMPKGRAFNMMSKGEGIDVMFGSATVEREMHYLPIQFPLMRGLNGWRIPLINSQQKTIFKSISTLADYKTLKPGQRGSWTDTKVLEFNGINVVKSSNYEGLYNMLHQRRFDYFPRSVLKIKQDLIDNHQLDLMIDPYVLIHYPTAYYFYVRKDNKLLANDITKGLENALKDGELNALFMESYGDVVNEIKADKRRVFSLNNPFLPENTPLSRKELWIDLAK